ncbi:MAG: hypothetical protein JXA46_04700 [Dehalococcoidales bacterium]|nr:hypothetical protein [Dehalococcoidales bacterium]
MTDFLASAVTFKKATPEKLAFIILNMIDLAQTLFAISLGAHELNPLMSRMLCAPYQLYMVKVVIPVFLSWLLPGKILIPSIALLAVVIGWNTRELLIFLL